MIRTIYPYRIIGTDLFAITGSFTAPTGTVSAAKGFGATPAYSSAGVYTLTLPERYPYVLSVLATAGLAGTATTIVGSSWAYDSATGVLTITFHNAAGAATALPDGTQVNYLANIQRVQILGTV